MAELTDNKNNQKHALIIGGNCESEEASALRSIGYIVDIAVSVSDADKMIKSNQYDTIIQLNTNKKNQYQKQSSQNAQTKAKHYQTLFTRMTEGFIICKMIYDKNDIPVDFICIDANPAVEMHTGLKPKNIIGKTAKEVLPGIEQNWLKVLENVARTGQPTSFENYIKDLNRYYELYVFSPGKDQFAILFFDINERRKTEYALRASEKALLESNRRQELLSDTANRLLVSENPQGIVQYICEKVMKFLDCHTFFNFLVDEKAGYLRLNACAGIPDAERRRISKLDYGVAVCGCVARDGSRIIAEDIQNSFDERTELVKGYGIQAYACHPLLAQGGKVVGTLSFGSRTKTSFTNDELSLMKAIADQVSTAMERIRLLNVERQRAEELQTLLEAVPVAVWISHDPESLLITGSRSSYELLRLPMEANASKTAPENERPMNFRTVKNGKDIPLYQLPVQRAAKGDVIRDYEFDILFEDNTCRHLLGNASPLFDDEGKPRGSVAAFVDITDRKNAEEHKRETEAQMREFYKRTILAATEGKLQISEYDDIENITGSNLGSWNINEMDDIRNMRDEVIQIAINMGMDRTCINKFMGCAMEAVANAHKHAGGGTVSLSRIDDSLILKVSDSGPGIADITLPDIALTKGYTTAGTLGMGYKIMIHFADMVYLATGPKGTTVALKMHLHKKDSVPLTDTLLNSMHVTAYTDPQPAF